MWRQISLQELCLNLFKSIACEVARSEVMTTQASKLDINIDHILEEVGKQFDVTRERIRQIEAKALRKLR